MKKSEVKLLLCHYIISNSRYELKDAEKFLNFFNFSYQMQISKFEKDIQLIEVKRIQMKLPESELRLAKLYFNTEELFEIYELVFKFFFTVKRNGKSILLLQDIERVLELDTARCYAIRYRYFEKLYMKDISLHSYSRAALSYFLISFGNDGVIDHDELLHFRKLLKATNYRPKMPIEVFDFNCALDLVTIEQNEALAIRETLLGAASSDGSFHMSEIKYIKSIIEKTTKRNKHRNLNIDLLPFLTLNVIMSDGKLTGSEKKWFGERFKSHQVVNSINEYFLLFVLIGKNLEIYKSNKDFFDKLITRGNSYEVASKLYTIFMGRYLKLEEKQVLDFCESVLNFHGEKLFEFVNYFSKEKTSSEEVFMLMNMVTNDHVEPEMLNEFLGMTYVKTIYQKLKSNESLLEYYFICKSLFVDRKLSAREYDMLWGAFANLDIDFTLLEKAIGDYSLLHIESFSIDKYFEYLKENEAV